MPLTTRSRSKSKDKIVSTDGNNTQEVPANSPQNPADLTDTKIELYEEFHNEPRGSDAYQTINHPLGRILLRLAANSGAKDNEEMDKIKELCADFMSVLEWQKQESEVTILETSNKIEEKITKKELSHYQAGELVSPPKYFAPDKTLHLPNKLELASKYFPIKSSQKFDGSDKMSIIEFLSTINLAQEVCKLEEEEFKSYLLRATSGKVFNSLSQYIKYGYSVDDIYSTLLLLFDKRDSSQVCKGKLLRFKIANTENLTQAISRIMELSTRASQALPEGPSRTALFNLEACGCLLRALPTESSNLATNIHNSLASKLDRAPQFIELVKALNKHLDVVNRDITANGVNPQKSKHNDKNGKHSKKDAQVNVIRGKNSQKNEASPSKYTGKTSGLGVQQKKYCSLCGKNTHRASDICYAMRDDKNRIVQVVPSYTACTICEKNDKKLFHPETLCPDRKKSS